MLSKLVAQLFAELEDNVKKDECELEYKTHKTKKIKRSLCVFCQRCGNYMGRCREVAAVKKYDYCYCYHDPSKNVFIAESFTNPRDLVKKNAYYHGYDVNV